MATFSLYMQIYLAKKLAFYGLFADAFHGSVQLMHKRISKNPRDLLLSLVPSRNCLFQKLPSLPGQLERLRAPILVGHNFEPATNLHPFDVAAERGNAQMKVFADLQRASRAHLGGGDQDVHLTDLQVERSQSVIVDVGNDPIEHP